MSITSSQLLCLCLLPLLPHMGQHLIFTLIPISFSTHLSPLLIFLCKKACPFTIILKILLFSLKFGLWISEICNTIVIGDEFSKFTRFGNLTNWFAEVLHSGLCESICTMRGAQTNLVTYVTKTFGMVSYMDGRRSVRLEHFQEDWQIFIVIWSVLVVSQTNITGDHSILHHRVTLENLTSSSEGSFFSLIIILKRVSMSEFSLEMNIPMPFIILPMNNIHTYIIQSQSCALHQTSHRMCFLLCFHCKNFMPLLNLTHALLRNFLKVWTYPYLISI